MELGNLIFGNSRGEYPVDRDECQDVFCEFLRRNGFDSYGYYSTGRYSQSSYFDNDVFLVRPYYWGEDEDIAALPNFVYKPTGLEIQWYKYPLRDSYSNQPIDKNLLTEIIEACEKSMEVHVK